jgi:ribosomal protein S18 acetylase RimI-like enzyme
VARLDPRAVPPRWPWQRPLSDEHPEIKRLSPYDVRDLRLPWLSRFGPGSLAEHLSDHPGMGLWVPKTGEYCVAEPWRRRPDIAQIVEVVARKGKEALVQAMLDGLREQGYRMALLSSEVWRDAPALYSRTGFRYIQTIVFFQKELVRDEPMPHPGALPELTFSRAALSDLDLLIELDHAAFPWMWRNSREEFEDYLRMPSMVALSAWRGEEPVGYASYTLYDGWAHLDRLAVIEAQQGRGLGAAQLRHTLEAMIAAGSRYVRLSTQQENVRSHRLYKAFGFRQLRERMEIYGREL